MPNDARDLIYTPDQDKPCRLRCTDAEAARMRTNLQLIRMQGATIPLEPVINFEECRKRAKCRKSQQNADSGNARFRLRLRFPFVLLYLKKFHADSIGFTGAKLITGSSFSDYVAFHAAGLLLFHNRPGVRKSRRKSHRISSSLSAPASGSGLAEARRTRQCSPLRFDERAQSPRH